MSAIKLLKRCVNLFIFIVILWPIFALADQKTAGDFAQNVFTGAITIRGIIQDACLITGAFLILSSFFQYRRFRRNPSEMPIGRPITTLIVGLILIAITFIPLQN